jgi:uncharacterized membrane protein YgcG
VNEDIREGVRAPRAPAVPDDPDDSARRSTGSSPSVCVTRSGDTGVTLTTTVPGQAPVEQAIIADGAPHPVTDGDCSGTETTAWSKDGQRLFARAEVTCADGAPRAISGMALITPDNTWLDIRSFRLGSQPTTRVSRYTRADSDRGRRILTGGAPLSLEQIKEAATQVTDAVLEAAIVETNPFVPVNKRTLVELADAGVSADVIDLIVALAYPEHFVVERTERLAAGAIGSPFYGPYGLYDYYYSGFYYPAFYYSPFGYSYIGRYDPFFFRPIYGRPPRGRDDDRPSGTGRVIQGQGYTRVRPSQTGDGTSTDAVPRGAVPRSTAALAGSGGGSSNTGAASGGSTGSTGTASPEGYSSGSGGSSGGDGGGRTAQPR